MKIRIITLKNTIKTIFALLLLFVFAAHPNICIKGAQNGLKTAAFSVLPSILPFMILSKYIIANSLGFNFLFSTVGKIFNISPEGMEAVIFGTLSGYPTGATLLADQVKKKD